ncbi:hypothetical protein K474DRAFT_622640 [Panus rudis PR-1116 ss-1]|nr:hypothetical protein K474DRAFT_622640 [Panus rudis PR-1116 ss-1]
MAGPDATVLEITQLELQLEQKFNRLKTLKEERMRMLEYIAAELNVFEQKQTAWEEGANVVKQYEEVIDLATKIAEEKEAMIYQLVKEAKTARAQASEARATMESKNAERTKEKEGLENERRELEDLTRATLDENQREVQRVIDDIRRTQT